MLSGLIFLIFTVVIVLFVALVVYSAHNVNHWIRLSFGSICLNLLLWQISIFVADNAKDNLLLWNHLVFLWPTLAVMSCFIFVMLLTPSHGGTSLMGRRNRAAILFVGALVAVQLIAIASSRIFVSISYDTITATYVFVRGPFYFVYVAGLVGLLITVITRLFTNFYKTHDLQERRALRTVIITLGVAVVYGIFTNVILPVATGSQKLISLGLLTVDIFVVGFALSIVRHRFLNIRPYVFRATAYILTIILVSAFYVTVAGLLTGYLLNTVLNISTVVVLSSITLLVAVSFHPLQLYFNKITNRLFFRDYYESQDILDKIGDVLIGTVDVEEIQSKCNAILEGALNPSWIKYVILGDKHKTREAFQSQLLEMQQTVIVADELEYGKDILARLLKGEDIAVAVRLRTKYGDLGFILLGYKRSGTPYNVQDKRLLSVVADEIAIGLQNALRFEEIEDLNATLQERIENATRNLRRTNDKLKAMDETKDDFISMASHQLRTPLTSIKGYVSMVLDGDMGELNPAQRKALNQALISSQRMVFLIADLLNLSRLKTGRFVIESTPTRLADIIESEVNQLQETAKARELELVYTKPPHFPTLMLDETKIRQVAMNFMDNAIYYTHAGGRIVVELKETEKTVEFTVTDNGIGVPKVEQPHLFNKFYRAGNARKARPDGTGLGLFMAKKVIVAQGGSIIFHSKEDKGSTFGFMFAKAKLLASPHANPVFQETDPLSVAEKSLNA